MNERHHEVAAVTKPLSQRQLAPEKQEQETENRLSLQRDPLARVTTRPSDASTVHTHAILLNRTTTSQPSLAKHSLLQLQRTYGNKHVQRVVVLMREAQGDEQAAPEVEEAIQRARGGGRALDCGVRAQMGAAFGVDFSDVRIHVDAEANTLNRAVSARAFTTGKDIFFGEGEYSPGSSNGRALLAHELTHVVQQNGSAIQTKLRIGQPGDVYEQEADRVAQEVMRMLEPGASEGTTVSQQAQSARLQRMCPECEDELRQQPMEDQQEEEILRSEGTRPSIAFQRRGEPSSSWVSDVIQRAGDPRAIPPGFPCPTDLIPGRPAGTDLLFPVDGFTITPGIARLQRQADITQVPLTMLLGPCILTAGPGHMPGTDVLFGLNASTIAASQRPAIIAFVSSWVAAGSKDDVIVDGWASVDGPQPLNWQLSCDRAEAVKAELVAQGVPVGKITTFAHGESTEFSATDLAKNRRAIITTRPVPGPPRPALAAAITSETVATSPGARTRTNIGVGEEVRLTHAGGSVTWVTTGGTLSSTVGTTVTLTAPDTAQSVIVTGGGARIAFNVLAPTGVHMDRAAGTGVIHTKDHADSGIRTKPFLLPDTVNFLNVVYREMNVGAAATTPGPYSCFPATTGHCRQPAGGACPDLFMTDTVVAGKGTQARSDDCVYSGDCQQAPPFAAGSIVFNIPYEFKVGAGPFRQFVVVHQESNLAADATTLNSSKAGASGTTTVPAATVRIPGCPP